MLDQKLKDIHKRVSEDLEVKKNLPASFKNVLSIALSGLTYTVIEQLKKSEELLPSKATKDNLDDWGKVYGVRRLNSKQAEIIVTIMSNKKLSLEVGELSFLDETSQAKFLNTEILEIVKGENTIKATAEKPGYIDLSKASVSLSNSHENIETDVTFKIVSQGLNNEADDNYRQRILNRIVQIPQSGTITDFIKWIERGDPKIKAFVKPVYNGPGTVGITFLQKIGKTFEKPVKERVEKILQTLEKLAPATSEISFIPPKKREVLIDFSLTPDDPIIRQDIKDKITEYFNEIAEVYGFKNKKCQNTIDTIWRNKIVQILEKAAIGKGTTLHHPERNIFLKGGEFAVPKF